MAGTRTTYGPDVLETVWALMREMADGSGVVRRAEIRRRMAADQGGLGRRVDLPKRTLDEMVDRLKRDRGNPPPLVRQSDAPSVLNAIELAAIAGLDAETKRILRKQADGQELSSADVTKLRTAAITARELKRRRDGKKGPDASNGNGSANAASPSSLTAQLRKRLGEKGKQEARGDTDAPDTGTDGS